MSHDNHRAAWDRQWRGNLLSTLAGSLTPDTAALIERGWAAFFGRLPSGAAVLDLATGNGYLALLALRAADRAGKTFQVHGADYAAIDPPRAVPGLAAELARIEFHPRVACEKLMFAADTFDAVVSQHGIEYADTGAAIREAARVLKPGGKARFLVHARGGAILAANLPKINQCEYVLEKAKLFDATDRAVTDALAGRGGDGAALKKALSETANRFANDPNTADLDTLLNLLWGAYEQRKNFPGLAAFRGWLSENRKQTEAQLHRIRAMEKAALDQTGVKQFAGKMKTAGFGAVRTARFEAKGGALIGYLIEAEKG